MWKKKNWNLRTFAKSLINVLDYGTIGVTIKKGDKSMSKGGMLLKDVHKVKSQARKMSLCLNDGDVFQIWRQSGIVHKFQMIEGYICHTGSHLCGDATLDGLLKGIGRMPLLPA